MGLEKLLYLQGVGAEFIDCFGNNVQISPEDRNGILKSMCLGYLGLQRQSDADVLSGSYIEQRIYELDVKPWLNPLRQFQWSYVDTPSVEVYLPETFDGNLRFELVTELNDTYRFQIHSNQLTVAGDYRVGDSNYFKYQYSLSQLSNIPVGLGYHQISLAVESDNFVHTYTGQYMLAPRSAYCGSIDSDSSSSDIIGTKNIRTKSINNNDFSSNDFRSNNFCNNSDTHKPWGISTQLYSIKSDTQWGIGDFNDLLKLISYSAEQGADFILLNPLHALDLPNNLSPYSPDDRRWLNPLYIHIESVDEYACIANQIESQEFQDKRAYLINGSLLNYAAVYDLKYTIYRLLFNAFISKNRLVRTKRYDQFNQFKQQQGEALAQYVTHHTELIKTCSNNSDTGSDADFICYLQFIASEQLAICQLKSKSVGMLIGLVRDMAVGASPNGAEVQQNSGYFCQQASIGAPPDPFAPQGQNWGLTPLDPINLQQNNFKHFISLIRSNMQSCGGLRIDHVMGLLRLWWWPTDTDNGKGAYVYYPLDTLLAILCLESQRAQCLLIGEDLGIVPPEIVQNLSKAKIFSNELFYFTKNHHGFSAPEFYKTHSLMMLANHDVPTLSAWWSNDDIKLRHELELIDYEQFQTSLQQRESEKQQLVNLLKEQQLLMPQTVVETLSLNQLLPAWFSLTASGESMLYSVQIDDLIDETKPINIPGTWKEYSNWQRRLSVSLEQIMASDEVKQKLKIINQVRHGKVPEYSQQIQKMTDCIK
ncbi:4-alpha-glucanotransferase [Shewanella goraebulensis]|uniref:4-alpha-glucanotransferase n=1 Tax=Shewanella goraebulensis TaxID=3050637 RepID=UPI00254BFC57|nr:4-alpha-glucanotransferase [Shewanella goraebulensis]